MLLSDSWKRILLNAGITGVIAALSCYVSRSDDMSSAGVIAAACAGLLSFAIEVKKASDAMTPPPTTGKRITKKPLYCFVGFL